MRASFLEHSIERPDARILTARRLPRRRTYGESAILARLPGGKATWQDEVRTGTSVSLRTCGVRSSHASFCSLRSRTAFLFRWPLAARGESLAAFDERCIPAPPQRGCRVGLPGLAALLLRQILPVLPPHRANH